MGILVKLKDAPRLRSRVSTSGTVESPPGRFPGGGAQSRLGIRKPCAPGPARRSREALWGLGGSPVAAVMVSLSRGGPSLP